MQTSSTEKKKIVVEDHSNVRQSDKETASSATAPIQRPLKTEERKEERQSAAKELGVNKAEQPKAEKKAASAEDTKFRKLQQRINSIAGDASKIEEQLQRLQASLERVADKLPPVLWGLSSSRLQPRKVHSFVNLGQSLVRLRNRIAYKAGVASEDLLRCLFSLDSVHGAAIRAARKAQVLRVKKLIDQADELRRLAQHFKRSLFSYLQRRLQKRKAQRATTNTKSTEQKAAAEGKNVDSIVPLQAQASASQTAAQLDDSESESEEDNEQIDAKDEQMEVQDEDTMDEEEEKEMDEAESDDEEHSSQHTQPRKSGVSRSRKEFLALRGQYPQVPLHFEEDTDGSHLYATARLAGLRRELVYVHKDAAKRAVTIYGLCKQVRPTPQLRGFGFHSIFGVPRPTTRTVWFEETLRIPRGVSMQFVDVQVDEEEGLLVLQMPLLRRKAAHSPAPWRSSFPVMSFW